MNVMFNNSEIEQLRDIAKEWNISTEDFEGIVNDLKLVIDMHLNGDNVASSKVLEVLGINTEDEKDALDAINMIIGYMFMVGIRHFRTDEFDGREFVDGILNTIKESIED